MIELEKLIGISVGDAEFVEFWKDGEIDQSPIEVDGEYSLSQSERGLAVDISKELTLDTITLLSGKHAGVLGHYKAYRGVLPDGLKFGMKKSQIANLLGAPIAENNKFSIFMGVEVYPWQKFQKHDYTLNITFDKKGKKVIGVSLNSCRENREL